MTFYDVWAICYLLSPHAVLFVAVNVFVVATVACLTRFENTYTLPENVSLKSTVYQFFYDFIK